MNTLFIGITSWNSELFLGCCLAAIKKTTKNIDTQIVVFDNGSSDHSVEIALEHGAEVMHGPLPQGHAMNRLLNLSDAKYTLLMHADTILLSDHWFDICARQINDQIALVSPEDIGCGPMTRDFGVGHPESSFLFFDTKAAKQSRQWKIIRRRFLVPLEIRKLLDFYGHHVTHNLVSVLADAGKCWQAMQVLHSDVKSTPLYQPTVQSEVWTDLLGKLEYGLGNFYALEGEITHYHNWYDRALKPPSLNDSKSTVEVNSDGFEVDYIRQYSLRFINDYQNNQLNLPSLM